MLFSCLLAQFTLHNHFVYNILICQDDITCIVINEVCCLFQIRGIFSNIGTQMDYDSFDKVYNLASSRHPKGHVCVESFRNVLDEFQATQLHRTPIVY